MYGSLYVWPLFIKIELLIQFLILLCCEDYIKYKMADCF